MLIRFQLRLLLIRLLPLLILAIGKQSELDGISSCLPPGLNTPPSCHNPQTFGKNRNLRLDMLLPFSTRFNPLLLPSRFPSMTLTSSPSPNIAGIVRVDIPDIVFHIVTKPPSALSAPAPADAASFLKGAASPPSCRCSWQHTGGKRQHTGEEKRPKELFVRFRCLSKSVLSTWRSFRYS